MAVARLKKLKKKGFLTILSIVVIAAVIIGCLISFVITQASISDMQTELQTIIQKTEEVEEENAELQRILEDDDMNA